MVFRFSNMFRYASSRRVLLQLINDVSCLSTLKHISQRFFTKSLSASITKKKTAELAAIFLN
jgi:hypothetical protein